MIKPLTTEWHYCLIIRSDKYFVSVFCVVLKSVLSMYRIEENCHGSSVWSKIFLRDFCAQCPWYSRNSTLSTLLWLVVLVDTKLYGLGGHIHWGMNRKRSQGTEAKRISGVTTLRTKDGAIYLSWIEQFSRHCIYTSSAGLRRHFSLLSFSFSASG